MLPAWLPWALALLAATLGLLAWWWARGRMRRGNRRRQRDASSGEVDAETLLADAGYRVLERQVTRRWVLHVDGEPVEVHCRADLLVEARSRAPVPRGTRFVAEVKTGTRAPDPTHPSTRRQLLEYLLVFEVEGVLLVDAEAGRVRQIAFPFLDPEQASAP
jgi:hypothetical protein